MAPWRRITLADEYSVPKKIAHIRLKNLQVMKICNGRNKIYLRSALRHLKWLSACECLLTECEPKWFDDFFMSLKHLNRLPELKLDFFGSHQENEKILKNFEVNLRHFKSLSRIRINFVLDRIKVYADIFKKIASVLKRFDSLSELQLIFFSCLSVTDLDVEIIILGIKRLFSLSSLKFYFDASYNLTNVPLQKLSSTIQTFSSLTKLEVGFVEVLI